MLSVKSLNDCYYPFAQYHCLYKQALYIATNTRYQQENVSFRL